MVPSGCNKPDEKTFVTNTVSSPLQYILWVRILQAEILFFWYCYETLEF